MTTATIYVSKDAMGDINYFPDNNYGSLLFTEAGSSGSEAYDAFLEFDISSIPSGSTINSCTLNISVINATGTAAVSFKRMTAQFTESTVTHNNAPATTETNATSQVISTTGWKSITITGMLSDALSGGYLGVKALGGSLIAFRTKEYSGGSEKAYLTVDYTLPSYGNIFVNSSTGDDTKDGSTPANAKKTFASAYSALNANGTIHVLNAGADFSSESISFTKGLSVIGTGAGFYLPQFN